MTDHGLRRLAAVLAAAAITIELAAAVLSAVLGNVPETVGAVLALSFPTIGAVIVRSQVRNGVGWVFLIAGLCECLNAFGDRFSTIAVQHGWSEAVSRPGAVATIMWFPALFLLITLGLLYFPTGRLPGRGWRWLEWFALALMADWLLTIGIAGAGVPTRVLKTQHEPVLSGFRAILFDIGSAAIGLIVPCVLGAIASVVLRWRRSGPVERLQIRWVAAAGCVATGAEIVLDLGPGFGLHVTADAQTIVESTSFTLIAVATGVAITRYRLYEIDRIVSRTLAYAVVTVLLGATYVGIVALGAAVIPDAYGSVGVAAATLAVAALFVPLRRRIQAVVDRRFNRSRYDAARTVDLFATHLRGDLTQTQLSSELLRTVQHAVAPASATVWLVRH